MLNKIQIIGRLGREPETKTLKSGDSVCNFSVACSEKYTSKAGEKVENTEWFNVVVFRKLAEICGQYLHQGSLVYIEGKIKNEKWQDKDGNDRTGFKVVADQMKMLGSKGDNQFSGADNAGYNTQNDDDIPF